MSNTDTDTKGLAITRGHGFHMNFANGWSVSVQFGPSNYCSPQGGRFGPMDGPEKAIKEMGAWKASSAEVAVFVPDERAKPNESCGNFLRRITAHDDVAGWVSPDRVAQLLASVAGFTPETSDETAARICRAIVDVHDDE